MSDWGERPKTSADYAYQEKQRKKKEREEKIREEEYLERKERKQREKDDREYENMLKHYGFKKLY